MAIKKKICIVATVPYALRVFMLEHIRELSRDHEVTLMANAENHQMDGLFNEHVRFIRLPIERKPSVFSDVRTLWLLYRIFAREKFDCVFSIMPKAGLLAMVAGFMARVPHRFHMFTGQVWFTNGGVVRWGLKKLDNVLALCATHVMADSPSQRQFLIEEGVVTPRKITVFGKGSISGVVVQRFRPNPVVREKYRKELGINDHAVVFLFMARLTRVKGALDVTRAFCRVAAEMPDAHLLVIGPEDEEGIESELTVIMSDFTDRYHRVGFTYDPEGYMAAADVFCIPSYREGFSSATIQAAGVGLPAIASRIYGLSDAVEEGGSGLFHAPGALEEIGAAMKTLYTDKDMRARLSARANERAHGDFSQSLIVHEFASFIRAALH